MLVAVALVIWSSIELWRIGHNMGIHNGPFRSTIFGLAFGCISIAGTVGTLLKANWGRIFILFLSALSALYAVAYLLLGGFEDTGLLYAIAVSGLFLLSIATLAILGKKDKFKQWQLNKPIEAARE